MMNYFGKLAVLAGMCMVSALYVSCEMLGSGAEESEGCLRISFADTPSELTRTSEEVPDTSDFILTVADASGKVLFKGKYGASPESMMVLPGSYTVSVVSEEFEKPAFSSPQYGDEQCVVVPSGGVAVVRLTCSQVNCGVRLDVDSGFLDSYPDGVLFLKSSEGKLMYGYSEKRVAYFKPGNVSLVMSRGKTDEVLMTRNLQAQQILVLGVKVASSSHGGSGTKPEETISVSVDTSRIWMSEDYVIGGDDSKGSSSSDALTVSQARSSAGEKSVWVSGYIVGGDLTSSSASFEGPFTSKTCILLGSRSSSRDRSACISVQLPSGNLRDALNLVDNPHLLGSKVVVKGDLVSSYYGLTGLKNCSDFSF